MNNFFTQFKNLARTVKLSQNEKQHMRVKLYTYFEQNPVGNFAVPAPVVALRPVPSSFYFFSPRYMVPVALLLVVGLSGGTAFAAQSALPGNPLYAVKINVNEPVQVALATTPQAKAQVNAAIATTRLEEAETLASSGTLDASTTAELASNFTAHAQAAQAVTQTLASNDPGAAAQLGADFTSTLAAHGALLAEIGDDSKDDAVMQNSNSLAIKVRQEVDRGDRGGEGQSSDDNSGIMLAIATASNAAAPASATSSVSNDAQHSIRVRTFAAALPPAATGTASSSGTTSAPSKAKGKNVTAITADNAGSGNGNDAKIAASLGAQATTSIAAMQKDFAALGSTIDANTSAQLTAQIAAVQTLDASAAAELAAGDASSAIRDFVSVIRTAVKLDAYFKAGKTINLKLLSGLISNPGGKGGPDDQDAGGSLNVQLHL